MAFRKSIIAAVLLLIFIILLTALGVYVLFNTYFWLTALWIFLLLILVVIYFLRFITKTYTKFLFFLESIQEGDFSGSANKNYKDDELNNAFIRLSDIIALLRDNAQLNYNYLQAIINHIHTAIICVNRVGEIVLFNQMAGILFNKSVLRNLDSLKVKNENLPYILEKLRTGEKKLIKFIESGELNIYSVNVSEFKLGDDYYKLFSFQNLQSEVEHVELESWQKLTRVITHEIMNSAIPISNLSKISYESLFDENGELGKNLTEEETRDIKEGLKTIAGRSAGLANFVNATKSFTKMPKPDFKSTEISSLISETMILLKSQFEKSKIKVEVQIEEGLNVLADKSLIEQAIINILLNAMDALAGIENPKIQISAFENTDNHICIRIEDNGKGIPEKELENIFIPFHTTKKNGSGIGLSITKQIMFAHKGNILLKSEPGKGSAFTLIF